MHQYKLNYRNWDIAVDLSDSTGEIYVNNGFDSELIYEGIDLFNTIDFFEMLDILIDKYEARKDAALAAYALPESNRDDIPF